MMDNNSQIIINNKLILYQELSNITKEAKMVFVEGIPGIGKSLIINQLAHISYNFNRYVIFLQWDIVRQYFENSEFGKKYPKTNGVTNEIIRIAVGIWAREKIKKWNSEYSDNKYLFIWEIPLVGHRLVELVQPINDYSENILTNKKSIFILPIPSKKVRLFLENERDRRLKNPQNEREKEDAPSHVLKDLWFQIIDVAKEFKFIEKSIKSETFEYDPEIYKKVYFEILKYRNTKIIPINDILPSQSISVYDIKIPYSELIPNKEDINKFINIAEQIYSNPDKLNNVIYNWWKIKTPYYYLFGVNI